MKKIQRQHCCQPNLLGEVLRFLRSLLETKGRLFNEGMRVGYRTRKLLVRFLSRKWENGCCNLHTSLRIFLECSITVWQIERNISQECSYPLDEHTGTLLQTFAAGFEILFPVFLANCFVVKSVAGFCSCVIWRKHQSLTFMSLLKISSCIRIFFCARKMLLPDRRCELVVSLYIEEMKHFITK